MAQVSCFGVPLAAGFERSLERRRGYVAIAGGGSAVGGSTVVKIEEDRYMFEFRRLIWTSVLRERFNPSPFKKRGGRGSLGVW